MTACAVLASSAKADHQVINMVNLDHTISHLGLIRPYNVVPVNQVNYNNAFGYDLTQPLSSYGMPTYGAAAFPTHHFIKREVNLESPYIIKSKMDNPIDGSEQEVQIEVDSSGKGQSFQHVEQKDQHDIMRHNYIMEHRRMAQRPIISKMYLAAPRGVDMNHYMGMNQMRQMDRHQIAMGRNHVDMYGRKVNLEKKQEEFQEQIEKLKQRVGVLGTQGGQSIPLINTQQGGTQQGGTQQGGTQQGGTQQGGTQQGGTQQGGTQQGGTQQGANMTPVNQIAQVFQQTVDRTASTRIEQAIQQQLEETLSEALKHINKGLDWLETADVLKAALTHL